MNNPIARDLANHFGKDVIARFLQYADLCETADVPGKDAYVEFLLELTILTSFLLKHVARPGQYPYVREAFITALRKVKE